MNKSSKFHIGLTAKICIVIMIISLSVTGLTSVLNYYEYREAVYLVHTEYSLKLCKAIEDTMTPDQWRDFSDIVNRYHAEEVSDEELEAFMAEPDYRTAIDQIQSITNSMELENVAVFVVDTESMNAITESNFTLEDSAILYFLMDIYSELPEEGIVPPGEAANWWDSYENFEMYRSILNTVIESGEDWSLTETVEDGSVYLSDYYPIKDGDEVVAVMQVSGDAIKITAFMDSFFTKTLITGILVTLILTILVIMYFYFSMVRPLQIIRREAEEFVQNNAELSDRLDKIHTRDEIQTLASSFLQMEKEVQEYIDKVAEVSEENARITTELSVATKIQVGMLPTIFPPYPERDDFMIYAMMDPAKDVGGDFYDFFFVDEKHFAIVIADVAGKGVPAALFMAISKSLLKNRAQMGGSLSEILYDVNNQLCEGNEEGMFVTVWMAIIDVTTGEGVAANAGHEHPVRTNNGSDYELVCYRHSMAMATIDGIPFKQHTFTLNPGDRIFVYTDGLPEAINSKNEAYGTDRFINILNQNKNAAPEVLLQMISEDVERFKGDEPQFDDLTMLMFEYRGHKKAED